MIYVRVTDVDSEVLEIPVDEDGNLSLANLAVNYPDVTGLKYRIEDNFRLIKLSNGILYPPEDSWGDRTYHCTYAKDTSKRKNDGDNDENLTSKHPRLDSAESKLSRTDLVVLGLPWTVTDKELHEYFSRYGELEWAEVKLDRFTNNSKGYGFIRFADHDVQNRVMNQRHCIGSRWCDVHIPIKKDGVVKKSPCKVFVGRCPVDVSEDDLREHFSKIGEISDLYVPKPFRGFAFVTFVDSSAAKDACGKEHVINGSKLHVVEAIPRNNAHRDSHARGMADSDDSLNYAMTDYDRYGGYQQQPNGAGRPKSQWTTMNNSGSNWRNDKDSWWSDYNHRSNNWNHHHNSTAYRRNATDAVNFNSNFSVGRDFNDTAYAIRNMSQFPPPPPPVANVVGDSNISSVTAYRW